MTKILKEKIKILIISAIAISASMPAMAGAKVTVGAALTTLGQMEFARKNCNIVAPEKLQTFAYSIVYTQTDMTKEQIIKEIVKISEADGELIGSSKYLDEYCQTLKEIYQQVK